MASSASAAIAVRSDAAQANPAPPTAPALIHGRRQALVLGASSAPSLPPSRWIWPLAPRPQVIRRFEPPDSPWGPGHRGVDLLATARQPVRAAAAGTVTFAGVIAGRGVVAITHGSVRTTYEPVNPHVHLGDHLTAGTPLGDLQPIATHCAPRTCLHWGALRGTTYIDPLQLLAAGRPRLLPLDDPPPTTHSGTPVVPPRPPDSPLPYSSPAIPPPLAATVASALAITALATTAVAEIAASLTATAPTASIPARAEPAVPRSPPRSVPTPPPQPRSPNLPPLRSPT
ncbi:murein hydrolase activator EnvC family protein [Flindersiella endophytica]